MSILKIKDSQGNWVGVPSIKGDKGDTGNGIQSAILNDDYTLTLTFTDGTTYKTPSIRGEKGEKGEPATDMEIHICSASEYDAETRMPTIANPNDKTFYLVPTEDGTSPDLFTEWVYVNGAWEMFGSASVDLTDYVKNTDIGTISKGGVFKVAADASIKAGSGSSVVVPTGNQHKSVFYGLAKASGDITQSQSNNPVGTYTDEAKASIKNMLGVEDVDIDSKAPVITETVTGSIASFDDGADMPLQSLVVDINPVQDTSSGDPSPENICPISGWSGANINVFGKNLLNSTLLKDQVAWNIIKFYAPVGTTLTMSTNQTKADTSGLLTYFKKPTDSQGSNENCLDGHPVTKIVGDEGYIEIIQRNRDSITSFSDFNYQIEVGSTATNYEPYIGNIISVDWTDEAGTIYGGKLDVLTGKLTVSKKKIIFNGSEGWGRYDAYNGYYIKISDMQSGERLKGISNYLTRSTTSAKDQKNAFWLGVNNSNLYIIGVHDSMGATIEDFKSYLNTNNLEVVYPLAEPIEIQLTPIEVNSLLGQNNIFADTGDTSVEYRADTELYIEKTKPVVNVDDVQINGTSIVENGVANVPIASSSQLGAVRSRAGDNGIQILGSGYIATYVATDNDVKGGNQPYRPIAANRQHSATFYGLAKASGADEKNSTLPVGQYTDNAKDSIQNMLGITPLIASHETDPFESNHVIGELFIIGGKLYRAKTALTAGEYINEGTNVEVVDVAGVLDDTYVKNTDYAVDRGKGGIVKVNRSLGISASLGVLTLAEVSSTTVKGGSSPYYAISPRYQHESVFYGLAKASGDSTQSASSNAVGTYTEEAKASIQTMLGVPSSDDVVSDVQIDGTSVVEGGVANIPKAASQKLGVVKPVAQYGTSVNNNGEIYIVSAYDALIKQGVQEYRPIVPYYQDYATFYGLAKAAGHDEKDSTLPVGTYTPEAKSAIRQMLSIADNYDSFIVDVEGTDPTITGQPSYRYNCGEVLSLTVTPPETGTIDFRFTSGSSPTVLTLPSTVKMPEWWVGVEANTIYEMCITDGVYCGVMSWAM